eukprot:jgi/Mesvir1/4703/Mv05629-RA.1
MALSGVENFNFAVLASGMEGIKTPVFSVGNSATNSATSSELGSDVDSVDQGTPAQCRTAEILARDTSSDRCRRTDGKRWRCSQKIVAGEKYCSVHLHRGRQGTSSGQAATEKAMAAAAAALAQGGRPGGRGRSAKTPSFSKDGSGGKDGISLGQEATAQVPARPSQNFSAEHTATGNPLAAKATSNGAVTPAGNASAGLPPLKPTSGLDARRGKDESHAAREAAKGDLSAQKQAPSKAGESAEKKPPRPHLNAPKDDVSGMPPDLDVLFPGAATGGTAVLSAATPWSSDKKTVGLGGPFLGEMDMVTADTQGGLAMDEGEVGAGPNGVASLAPLAQELTDPGFLDSLGLEDEMLSQGGELFASDWIKHSASQEFSYVPGGPAEGTKASLRGHGQDLGDLSSVIGNGGGAGMGHGSLSRGGGLADLASSGGACALSRQKPTVFNPVNLKDLMGSNNNSGRPHSMGMAMPGLGGRGMNPAVWARTAPPGGSPVAQTLAAQQQQQQQQSTPTNMSPAQTPLGMPGNPAQPAMSLQQPSPMPAQLQGQPAPPSMQPQGMMMAHSVPPGAPPPLAQPAGSSSQQQLDAGMPSLSHKPPALLANTPALFQNLRSEAELLEAMVAQGPGQVAQPLWSPAWSGAQMFDEQSMAAMNGHLGTLYQRGGWRADALAPNGTITMAKPPLCGSSMNNAPVGGPPAMKPGGMGMGVPSQAPLARDASLANIVNRQMSSGSLWKVTAGGRSASIGDILKMGCFGADAGGNRPGGVATLTNVVGGVPPGGIGNQFTSLVGGGKGSPTSPAAVIRGPLPVSPLRGSNVGTFFNPQHPADALGGKLRLVPENGGEELLLGAAPFPQEGAGGSSYMLTREGSRTAVVAPSKSGVPHYLEPGFQVLDGGLLMNAAFDGAAGLTAGDFSSMAHGRGRTNMEQWRGLLLSDYAADRMLEREEQALLAAQAESQEQLMSLRGGPGMEGGNSGGLAPMVGMGGAGGGDTSAGGGPAWPSLGRFRWRNEDGAEDMDDVLIGVESYAGVAPSHKMMRSRGPERQVKSWDDLIHNLNVPENASGPVMEAALGYEIARQLSWMRKAGMMMTMPPPDVSLG